MKKFAVYFIVLNLVWACAAFFYDLPVIVQMPVWAWPFIIICPVYPLLLALVWWNLYRGANHPVLLGIACIPAITYGVLAVFFYPLLVVQEGFSWLLVGQILWVEVYAGQALFFSRTQRTTRTGAALGSIFIAASLIIQHQTNSFGYLGLAVLTPFQRGFLLALGLGCSLGLFLLAERGRLKSTEKRKKNQAD